MRFLLVDTVSRMSDAEKMFWRTPELVDKLIPFLDVQACLLYVYVSVELGNQNTDTLLDVQACPLVFVFITLELDDQETDPLP